MDDARIARIGYVTQELNAELKELDDHVSGTWRCLGRVSERLHELLDLCNQLPKDMFHSGKTLH